MHEHQDLKPDATVIVRKRLYANVFTPIANVKSYVREAHQFNLRWNVPRFAHRPAEAENSTRNAPRKVGDLGLPVCIEKIQSEKRNVVNH